MITLMAGCKDIQKANDRSQQGLPEEAMQKANVVEDRWRADK
jgi:hypothetical protein